jgi:3-deoxy-manno-octulosonate cytidylyltransferase (CMP-KDO synthetase)|tara:strand:+ start:435 stop:1205 length:771 start_codon:yes stop_codon:yes gene_type:complete
MKVIAIIPARMNSSRFPGKPMTKIHGIPMIGHCFYRIKMCKDLLEVYVATCDDEIVNYIESIGGNAIMTSTSHERATDRTAEAMIKIEEMTGGNIDVVVMVQGDEPMITPEMITDAIQPFDNADTINVVNLMANIKSVEEFEDPNEVKVVVDNESNAVYFSREPIPSRKKGYDTVPMLKQVCVIPFKRDYLLKFNKMEETELERIESVDMMRIIENGEKVHMVLNDTTTYSVDTEQDKRNVENSMVGDLLLAKYKL